MRQKRSSRYLCTLTELKAGGAQIALWSQLRVPAASTAVIWDYYFVIVLRSLSWSQHRLLNTSPSIEEETWIYDLHSISELLTLWEDTSVPGRRVLFSPGSCQVYVKKTFPPDSGGKLELFAPVFARCQIYFHQGRIWRTIFVPFFVR
jgi:hypothetical protein